MRKTQLAVLTCPLLLFGGGYTFAQAASDAEQPGWLDQATLTGDWAGLRTELDQSGITPRAHFTAESAANPVGGLRQGADYTQQIDLGADFDLQRIFGLTGGTIQLTLTHRLGNSLTADDIGNLFAVQELYGAGQNFRLAELNYQQRFLDDTLFLEIGWAPMGDDLATNPFFCYFQNGVICGHANAMTTNSGAHNFPTGQWGTHLKLWVAPDYYITTGIFQVNPNEGDSDAGFNLSFRGTGVIVPVELGWTPGRAAGDPPGDVKIGAYYNSSRTPDVLTDTNGKSAGLTRLPFRQDDGRYGGYLMVDQMVYREAVGSNRGLTLGATAAFGDGETAKYGYYVSAGLVYQGTFPGRAADFVSAMVAYARINDRLTDFQEDRSLVAPGSVGIQTDESIIELDYGAQLAPWLILRPNLQYVIRPGATGAIPNALVFGLYSRATL